MTRPWHLVQTESVSYLPETALFQQTSRARPFLLKQGCCGLHRKCLNATDQGGHPKAERWTQQLGHQPLFQMTFRGSALPAALTRWYLGGGRNAHSILWAPRAMAGDALLPKVGSWALNSSAVTLCNSAGDTLYSLMSLNMKCNLQERACLHGFVLICCFPGDGVWQSWVTLFCSTTMEHQIPASHQHGQLLVRLKEIWTYICMYTHMHRHTHTYICTYRYTRLFLNLYHTKNQFLISISHLSTQDMT